MLKKLVLFCLTLILCLNLFQIPVTYGIARTSEDVIWDKAFSLHSKGKQRQALPLFRQYIETVRSGSKTDNYKAAFAFFMVGSDYINDGDRETGYGILTEGLIFAKKLTLNYDKNYVLIGILNDLGEIHRRLGEFDQALNFLEPAEKIASLSDKNKMFWGILQNKIGLIYDAWGIYDKALLYYKKSLDSNMQQDNRIEMANSMLSVGSIYGLMGKYKIELKYCKRALLIFEKEKAEKYQAIALNNIGVVHRNLGDLDTAMEYYSKSLSIAKAFKDEPMIATRLFNIAKVLVDKKAYTKALEKFLKALQLYNLHEQAPETASALSAIGSVYYELKDYSRAIHYLEKSIKIIETIRKTATGKDRLNYMNSEINVYQGLISSYFNLNTPADLFYSIEKSRARLLAEKLSEDTFEIPGLEVIQKELPPEDVILIYANTDWKKSILMVVSAKETALIELDTIESLKKHNINMSSPGFETDNYYRGLKISGSFLAENPFLNHQDNLSFSNAIRTYRNLLARNIRMDETGQMGSNGMSQMLYDILIQPAQSYIKFKKNILILADADLNFIPFETLMNEQGQYLCQNFNLRYAPSMTILNLINHRKYRHDRKPVLALGGAVYSPLPPSDVLYSSDRLSEYLKIGKARRFVKNGSINEAYALLGLNSWKNLPGTLKEVDAIQSFIPNTVVLSGNNVAENKLKALSATHELENFKIIHLATHGIVVQDMPELSAIVLSQFSPLKEGEDGYLRLDEIENLKIKADFVNLSACETGLGKLYGGEGVVGMAQSFFIAGANNLSASLWQVSDDSTAKFMTEVYRMVAQEKLPFDEAIFRVKQNFIKGEYGSHWSAPYYWAPFIYYGMGNQSFL